MAFEGFIGQKSIIGRLEHALSNQTLSHAYVFSGPSGIGKRTLARAFCAELLCIKPDENGRCGICAGCKAYESNLPADFYWIASNEASLGIERIRDMQKDMAQKPLYSNRKVYVIASEDSLTVQAQNALLKVFEEPLDHIVIMLTVSDEKMLLPTVRSRSVLYELQRYGKPEFYEILKKHHASMNQIDVDGMYGCSEGVPGQALEWMQSENFAMHLDAMMRLIKQISQDSLDLLEMVGYFEKYTAHMRLMLKLLLLFYRDILAVFMNQEASIYNRERRSFIQKATESLNERRVVKSIRCIVDTDYQLTKNANVRLAIENMLITLMED